MAQGLSEQSHTQWGAFSQSVRNDASRAFDRELLNQFLIGVHQRSEDLLAHDLKTLVDELKVAPELGRDIMAFVEPALALLEAYDRSHPGHADDGAGDDDDDSEVAYVGDADVGPGILVM
jgi:hypothetical protein